MKDVLKRLGVMLIDLVTSKKAIATIVASVVALVVKDPAQRDKVVEMIMVYVASQGIVDHAKAKAEAALRLGGAK